PDYAHSVLCDSLYLSLLNLLPLLLYLLLLPFLFRPLPCSPLFPYTTLFRSLGPAATARAALRPRGGDLRHRHLPPPPRDRSAARSEEHTSELQSRFDLVCRLLLEKKKYI